MIGDATEAYTASHPAPSIFLLLLHVFQLSLRGLSQHPHIEGPERPDPQKVLSYLQRQNHTHAKPVDFLTPASTADTANASNVKWKIRPNMLLSGYCSFI